jgi:predicted enzyme related to lactoylglutathione lyase
MKIQHQIVVFDAADPIAESSFWAGVLNGTADTRDDDWHMVIVDGQPRIGVQRAPDHIPPQWPDGNPQQVHLDLWVDDIDAAHERVMALGAKLLQGATGGDSGDDFQVYADPAGHPFCLCWLTKKG